ncbi:hypothetical protein pb186bvf_000685 [Paramecium bursaria]
MTSLLRILTIIGFCAFLSSAQFLELEDSETVLLDYGFTADFKSFIASKYSTYQLDRSDVSQCCYGGSDTRPTGPPSRYPIVFIHGNSDIGMGNGGSVGWQTGFNQLVNYLQSNGQYTKADLFVATWGPANPNLASQNAHTEKYVMFARKFIEAVLEYTQSPKVYVVGHSMGVTLARQAIIGGQASDSILSKYEIGASITSKVETFFGLAGANYGLVDCTYATGLPTCSTTNGFSPSSAYLARINQQTHREGTKVYSYWSPNDDIIKYQCLVKGKNTCEVPGSDQSFSYSGYTHFDVRDKTGADILKFLTK